MQPFKNRAETFIALFILIALGVLSAYLAVFIAFLGVCAYLYLEYEANNLGFHVEVLKSAILNSSIWLQSTMSSFVRNLQQRSGLVSDEPKSEMPNISRPDSPVTSRLRRVSIATNGSRYSRNSDLNISRSVSSSTRYRLSPANRSVLDVCNRSDSRSPQKQSYSEAMGYAYKSSPWNRSAHSPVSEKTRTPSNTSVRTVQNMGGPLLASSRSNSSKPFDLRVYADANSPGLAERSVYYSRAGGASPGRMADENRRPLSPPAVTHQPQYRTVGQFPLVRLGQKGSPAASLPLLTAAVSPKAPRAHPLSMNVAAALVESPAPAPLAPTAGKVHTLTAASVSSPGLSGPDRSDPHDISAKSVIEALKEISRKRIRSQCLTPNEVPEDESAKRQRRNVSSDSGRLNNSEAMENTSSPVTPSAYQTKRGRSDSFNASSESGSASRSAANDETPGVRSRVKRLCSNEILSSLSSSRCLLALAASNKRKFTISPDGSPRSGTPVPVQTGKHFKSGTSLDTEEQNGREEDMVHAMETPVRRRLGESAVEKAEDTPTSPTSARTPTPARSAGASATDAEDVTPEHWKRPKDVDRDTAVPHRATPHPARKLVGAKDLAEQRRADRSALVGLLTVIGKGESPFRDTDYLQPSTSGQSSRQQKHVSFADTQKPGELARADTAPITESQQAPCVGTPTTASSPGQGGMAGTGTTNTPPTVSRNTQKAQAFTLHASPSGSVMSSSAAASGRSPSPFTVSAGQQPASVSSAGSGTASVSTPSTAAAQTASPFTARPLAASTPAATSSSAATAPTGASSPFASTTRQVTGNSEAGGTPAGARAAPGDAASQPQVHMSTATSTAFSFGSPKMSTVATVSATPTTAAGGSTSAGELRFGADSAIPSMTTPSAGGFSFALTTSAAPTATSPPKVAFQFGQSAVSTAAEAKPGGFQFTPGAADKSGRQAATSGPGATASQPSIFSSSASYSKATATETAVSPFAAAPSSKSQTVVTTAPALQKGVFGGASAAAAQQSTFGGAPAPVFGASGAASTQAPTFSTPPVSSSQAPTFGSTTQSSVFGTSVFGSTTQSQSHSQPASSTSNVTQASAFGTVTTVATPAFGSATTASTPAFGLATTASTPAFGSATTASIPAFGSATSASTPAFGSATSASTPAFGSATTASTPAFVSATTAPSLTFGSGTTTQTPAFGSGATSQTPAFGSGATSQTPAFGSGATSQTPAFGSGTTTQTPAFGSGTTTQTPAFGSGTTSQTPAFGSGTTSQTTAFGSGTASQTPAFGSGTTTPAPAFGAGNSSQTPAFGSGTTTQTATFGAISTSQASAFGSGTTPAFGAGTTNQTPAFGSGSQSQPTMFGSGSSTQASAFGSGSNRVVTFGSGTGGQTPAGGTGRGAAPSSGSQVAAFGAGATGQAPAFGSTSGQTSAFGSTDAQAPTFGSGSSGSTPAFGSANRPTVFGSGATPSFGAASSTAATTQSSVFGAATPAFGSAGASRPPFGSASPFGSTPAFGSTSTGQTPAFGSPFAASGDAKPAFGTTAQASTAVTTAGQQAVFAFGSTSAAPTTTTAAAPTPFQFGATGQTASAATPKPGGFQFGQSADASPAPFPFGAPAGQTSTPKPAFQFNAGGQTPGGSVPNVFGQGTPGSVGMFSIGSGSTAPRSRTSRMRNKNR